MRRKMLILLCMLVLSAVLVAGLGRLLRDDILQPLGLFQDEHPVKVVFMLMADEAAQFAVQNRPTEEETTEATEETTEATEESTEATEESTETTEETTETTEETTEATEETTETTEETAEVTEETTEATEATTEATEEPIVITEEWFSDVLFIGDSRTTGFRDMARLGEADYFCASSMSIYQIMQTRCSDRDFFNKSLDYVLSNNTYGKIYIHLGLNECIYSHDLIIEKYQELIDMIKEKQPDAAIIIQSVMTVRESFANSTKFTLERIYGLNEKLQQLAIDNEIFYEETNEFAANEDGYMRPEISYDGAHPLGSGYQEWAQWIMENASNWGIA